MAKRKPHWLLGNLGEMDGNDCFTHIANSLKLNPKIYANLMGSECVGSGAARPVSSPPYDVVIGLAGLPLAQ